MPLNKETKLLSLSIYIYIYIRKFNNLYIGSILLPNNDDKFLNLYYQEQTQ